MERKKFHGFLPSTVTKLVKKKLPNVFICHLFFEFTKTAIRFYKFSLINNTMLSHVM